MTAALATLGVHGAGALRLVWSKIEFPASEKRKKQLPPLDEEALPKRVHYAHWPLLNGSVSEEVVLCPTDCHTVEIHCHGGVAVSNEILESLNSSGCRIVDWKTWSQRTASSRMALGNGPREQPSLTRSPVPNSEDVLQARPARMVEAKRFDLRQQVALAIRLAAERKMIEATSEPSAGYLLDQYNGALWGSLEELNHLLQAEEWQAAGKHVEQLLRWSQFGRHLAIPWSVVLAGPPNVGKSSLMNALSGQKHSIVHSQPGTTRDWIEAPTHIDGWSVCLTDTAGLRDTNEEIEREGVLRAKQKLASADLVVVVVDATVGWTAEHDRTLALCLQRPDPPRLLCAWNKFDLLVQNDLPDALPQEYLYNGQRVAVPAVYCSALKPTGELWKGIVTALVPVVPPIGTAIPFTECQIGLLQQLLQQLKQPLSGIGLNWERLLEYDV